MSRTMDDDRALEEAIAREVDRSIPFIEAHHHIWELARFPYRWIRDEVKPDGSIAPVVDATATLGEYKILRQDWTMERLLREFYGANVVGSVHIEADCGADDPVEETVWLEEVAERVGMPDAIVVYADVTRPGVAAQLDRHLAASGRVRGLRPRAHPADWRTPAFTEAMTGLGARDLSYEITASPGALLGARDAARAFPGTQMILGHTGIPIRRDAEHFAHWRAEMTEIAKEPNVACKVSGLGMYEHGWTVDSITPWVLHAIEAFGTDRIIFATNWPVDLVFSSYIRQVDAWRWVIARAGFSRAEQEAMLSGNARRLYRI